MPYVGTAREVGVVCAVWGTGSELLTQARAEVTRKYAVAYTKASKKEKGLILTQVCEMTGWNRDNARRRLRQAASAPPRRRGEQGEELLVRGGADECLNHPPRPRRGSPSVLVERCGDLLLGPRPGCGCGTGGGRRSRR